MKLFKALMIMMCLCIPSHAGMVVGNYYSTSAPTETMTIILGANDIIGLDTNDKIIF